ncbi:MAG: MGMT family protein [Methylococcaceae bacterium]|nr:MGMT family protein [Methylococcaceae bacterium]
MIIQWVELQNSVEKSYQIHTAAGNLVVYQIDNVITKTEWAIDESTKVYRVDDSLSKQIQDYLKNPKSTFTVRLKKQGSDFRNKVWIEICKIPAGQVLSYSEISTIIGSGARAVANACRDNPFPGIIPCHRVVSVSGLGGYMGKASGKPLEIKKKLLAMEAEFF